ncbi:MAG: metallophosphoesterase [Thermomicrobiales bacterium]|nr:metallophosphoesterase [Thermomicrobiales bacterium]
MPVMIASVSSPALAAPAARDSVVRVAAIGDMHMKGDGSSLAVGLGDLRGRADVLLVAGDITDNGRIIEAEAAVELLAEAKLPTAAVLGNHDLRALRRVAFRRVFERNGIAILEGSTCHITAGNGVRVGVAGITGSGGGFWPVEGPDAIHTRTLKRLAVRSRRESQLLDRALTSLDGDVAVALMHFAPTVSTLGREPLAKYWMLGNCELGLVLDRHKPDLVIHGHAHLGNLAGHTVGAVPVRNVAASVASGVHIEEVAPVAELARLGPWQR